MQEDQKIQKKSLSIVVLRDGIPAMIFNSDVEMDINILQAQLERMPKEDDANKTAALFSEVFGNMSSIDQEIFEIDAKFFLRMFAAFSFYPVNQDSALYTTDEDSLKVYAFVLR